MSMDFPDYEKIRLKSRKFAFLWMVGDRFHYIGLLGAIFIVCAAPAFAFFTHLKGNQVGLDLWNWGGLAAFLACLLLLKFGIPIKHYARRRAGIEGD